MTKEISPSGSFKGYDWKVWFTKNKEQIKVVVSALSGLTTGLLSGLTANWAAPVVVIVAMLSKWALDAIDFYATNVKIQSSN